MNTLEAKTLALFSTFRGHQREEEQARSKQAMTEAIVSEEHMINIVDGVLRTRNETGATEVELQEVINTIIQDRYMATCSELAGKGLLNIHFFPDRPVGRRLVYSFREGLNAEQGKRLLREHQQDQSAQAARGLRRSHGDEGVEAVPAATGRG